MCPRGGDKRPAAREEKNVGGGLRPGPLARDTRIPCSGDDGKRGNHAASPSENVGAVASWSTVAAAAKLGQRRGYRLGDLDRGEMLILPCWPRGGDGGWQYFLTSDGEGSVDGRVTEGEPVERAP